MKHIRCLNSPIPFRGGENFTTNKVDEKGKVILNKEGQPEKEDVLVRDILLRGVYEFLPQGTQLKTIKQVSKLADKLENSKEEVELSDEHYAILTVAVEQLSVALPQVNRAPLFKPVMIGRVLEMIEGETPEQKPEEAKA